MTNALDLIAGYKSGALTTVPARVVVVGAGNTAIDAAIASFGSAPPTCTLCIDGGPEKMSAFTFEYEHARSEGVKFLWHVQPTGVRGDKAVDGLELIKLVFDGRWVDCPATGLGVFARNGLDCSVDRAGHAHELSL